jgi:hypothetical protein
MNPFDVQTSGGSTGGSGSSNPFSPSKSAGVDLNSSEGLLSLAQQQGGAIGQVAEELVHPTKGILSSIGDGFKKAFTGFVDLISIPNQVIAGALSDKYSISEAIKQNISTSDVIFGDQDPNSTTMHKVGSFLVRTATDIVLDPLTYVTFGASKGVLGLSGLQKVQLGEKAAADLGKDVFSKVALSETTGEGLYRFLNAQAKGTAKAEELFLGLTKQGGEVEKVANAAKTTLEEMLVKHTLDAPLNIDFAKKAISQMLETNPAFAETILDKGGIKVLGKTILSGQRISSVLRMIPGMTMIDEATKPFRLALQAPFDSTIRKSETAGKYVRLPEEFVEKQRLMQTMYESRRDSAFKNLDSIVKQNDLTIEEAKSMANNLLTGTMPADARLSNVYKQAMGFSENELKWLQESGKDIARKDLFGFPLVRTDVENISFNPKSSSLAKKASASFERTSGKFVDKLTGEVRVGTAEGLGLTRQEAEAALVKDSVASHFAIPDMKNPETYKNIFTDSTGKEFERFAATMDELKASGLNFEDNFVIANAIRADENARVGSSTRFIRDITESMGRVASEAPSGWRPINMNNVSEQAEKLLGISAKGGEEIYFHPMIAQELENGVKAVITDDASKDFFKAYDKIQNLWKAGVTSIFPAFHGRNALSNVFQNFLDIGLNAINPATHSSASQMIFHDKQLNALEKVAYGGAEGSEQALEELHTLLGKKMFTDVSGYDWTVGEIRQVLKDRGIAFKGGTGQIDVFNPESVDTFTKELFGSASKKDTAKKILKGVTPLSQDFVPYKIGRELGSIVEDQAKLVNFMTNLKATGDVEHAAARTSMFLFDYQNLTKFEKTFLKRIIPFYTFTRKNLELQAKTLMTTPGRISAELTGLRNIGEAMSGGSLTEEEKSKLPAWLQSGIGILKSRKGSTLEMFSSLGTPIEQPFAAFQPNQFLGSVSPLLRVPIETATGYSWFQGKSLSDATNAAAYKNAPKALKDAIGYTEITGKRKDGTTFKWSVSLRPTMMNTINNLPLMGRVLNSLKQMEDVDVSAQGKILQQIVGVKAYSVNLDDETTKQEAELQKKLKELLTKAGVTAQFTRTYVPKDK